MIWARKRYPHGGYSADLDKFGKLFKALRGPRRMMMFEQVADHFEHQDLFIAVPDEATLAAMTGYERVTRTEVPTNAKEVVGLIFDVRDFEAHFGEGTATRK
jgi:hypothetical protein